MSGSDHGCRRAPDASGAASRRSASPVHDDEPDGPADPTPDLRLVAPALCAWAGALLALGAPASLRLPMLACCLVVLARACARSRWAVAGAALVTASAIACSTGHVHGCEHGPLAEAASDKAVVEVTARVAGDPVRFEQKGSFPPGTRVVAVVDTIELRGGSWRVRGRVEISASGTTGERLARLQVGERVHLLARAAPPRSRGDGYTAALRPQGDIGHVADPGPIDRAVNTVRSRLHESLRHNPDDQAGLVPSLVEGDLSALDPSLKEDFKAASLTHLTAVSGTNLTLMLAFFLLVARAAGVRGWWLRGLAVLVVMAFIVLCRAEPSVVRAAAMGVVALAATGRRGLGPAGLRHLSCAVWLLILVDPWLARSWGFALSVAATAGILLWSGRWRRAMGAWAPDWLAESVCVPAAAQLATQPIITALSGSISMAGVAANMAAGPFVAPVTVLGLMAALAGALCPPLGAGFGWCAGWCVEPIILIARWCGSLPAGTLSWPVSGWSLIVLTCVCLALAQVIGRVAHRPLACGALAVLLVVGCLWRPATPGWPSDWAIISCDVDQGDATLVRTGRRSAILIDVGPPGDAAARCLREQHVDHVSMLVLSHFHDDHIGGLEQIAGHVPIDLALLNPLESPAGGARHVQALLAAAGVPTRTARAGERISVGRVDWQTLQAATPETSGTADTGKENPAENDSSILGRVTVQGIALLVTGDLETSGQDRAVAAGLDLHADVLKVAHHGSARQSPEFLAATGSRLALISVGATNSYGHPAGRTLTELNRLGMQVARTDHNGAIAVAAGTGGALRVVSRR
ncbi:ComEC/Rec2 family competence protein [Propionibacterium australiense]|uniref:ComEC/Rec2 family competence protein n=1 Tax=Propionibacterium australiense TaxID=119981 RepID=A0A8B3FVY8_9ACTN|nr:ComEC/Rec2 family competence protein [Propionibacterium australiense]RLP10979.1 ComEC/Rec2 family competence protein [Propionibacterium australiense]RLP13054.1 ComEC/Rec2 family competence protein [Propionibacterium australiense]VEH90960.1 ComEC family competence protein [Propionibacterium australiense]